MKISTQTLSALLPKLLAEGLVVTMKGSHVKFPAIYAEIKGGLCFIATHAVEDDRDILRFEFDAIDTVYDGEALESFALVKNGENVVIAWRLADVGEEVLSPDVRDAIAKERERPRIVPFARGVIDEFRA